MFQWASRRNSFGQLFRISETLSAGNGPRLKNFGPVSIRCSAVRCLCSLSQRVSYIVTYYVVTGTTSVLVHNYGGAVQGHPTKCNCASNGVPDVRNGSLAGSVHPKTGIPFDNNGLPDFSSIRHPCVADVRTNLTGNRTRDETLANRAARLSGTPAGYTWNHYQDAGLMQIVERGPHRLTGHTSGFSGGR
ncbi:HNH endonuclease [Crossiella sp. S99.2]|uniref:HNH endonuclease n=1 Tax=unclassified Crossiella TaxID=2620835 RepID=UPI0035AB852E